MAVLTWRNVDTPNFSGATDGLRTASQLLSNAVRSGQDLISGFTQANSDAADRAILNRALAIQDPAAYQAALASGAIVGGNAGDASLATLRGLDTRASTLLDQATSRQGLEKGAVAIKAANQAFDQTAYNNQRLQANNALSDAAAPDLAQARILARNNDQAGLNKLLRSSTTLKALRPEQLSDLLTGVDTLSSNNQARRTNDTNFTQGNWRFNREQRNAADEDAAAKALVDVVRGSVSAGDATRIIDQKADSLSPGAFTRLLNGARGAGYPTFTPIIDGGGVSGGGVDTMTGGAKLPSSIRTVGDMVNFKSDLLGSNPKGTATGLYQITSDTWKEFGPKALGKDWESADIRDPQVQDKVAQNIWESVKDNPSGMRNRWVSLSDAESREMRGKSWADVRDVISRKESGTNASGLIGERQSLNFGGDLANQMIGERAGQMQVNNIAPELVQLQGDRRSAIDVAASLVGKDGVLAGSSKGAITERINKIREDSGGRINAAMAGAMITNSVTGAENRLQRAGAFAARYSPIGLGLEAAGLWTPSSGNLAGGVRINDKSVADQVNRYLSGQTSIDAAAQRTFAISKEAVDSAKESYNTAEAEYRSIRSAAKNRPGLADTVERYRERRDAAKQAFEEAQKLVANSDTLTPQYDRPKTNKSGR